MPRAKRREREIQRTREDILEAAARVFGRVGFTGATMQEIAREAGYTAPSLYTYFEGKEALLQELFASFLEQLLGLFERPTPRGLTLKQNLELLLHEAMEFCDRRRDALVAFATISAAGPNLAAFPMNGAVAKGSGSLAIITRARTWFTEKASPDELGPLGADGAAYTLYGVLSGLLMRWDHGGREGPLVDLVPQVVEFFFHGLAGVSAPEASSKAP